MPNPEISLILGNSNKRFSGVTSTMLQVLPHQKEIMPLIVLGKHHLPADTPYFSFCQFVKLCKKPLPDGSYRIFHARRNDEMIQALIAKKFFGAKIKIVFTSTAQRHHSKFTRWLMSKVDSIITTCAAANSYLKTPADIVIPHGIDTDTYSLKEETSSTLTDEINIGIFGRVRPSKGIDLLIDAIIPVLQSNPKIKLHVCGETTPKFHTYLKEQQEKLTNGQVSEQVKFLGKVPFNQLPSLYKQMDIVCAVSRNEGYGLTPLEAMASGTAVLTSKAGAWEEMVTNGVNGYCVPTNDSNAIREKLKLMISAPEKLKTMGLNGRQLVEQQYTNKGEALALCSYFKTLSQKELSKQ